MADVSVRPGTAGDAEHVARIQLETWQIGYAQILPTDVLAELARPEALGEATRTWRAALTTPPTPRHHVLVALEKDLVVGFSALAPDEESDQPDAATTTAVGPLLVEPRWGRRGHASRLLAASVDHARGDGMTRAVIWLPEADQASRSFFTAAGWAPDGYARALDTGSGELREIRMHTDLAE